MKITVTETKDRNLIKSIIINPILFAMSGISGTPEKYTPNLNDTWLCVKQDKIPVGLAHLHEFTKITTFAHIHILPEYQHKGMAATYTDAIKEWLQKNTQFISVTTYVPEQCAHMHKFLTAYGWEICGAVKDAVYYLDVLQPLIIYNINIRNKGD